MWTGGTGTLPGMNADRRPAGQRNFGYLAWAILGFSVLVILGGAIVRATGSGDGCGASWPRCTGRLFPTDPGVETVIEFSHRLMTLALGIGVVILVLLAFRFFPKGHVVRYAATASLVFLIIESLLGASLVLFGWVDQDASLGRVFVVPLHLLNTFILVALSALTAWWGSGNAAPEVAGRSSTVRRLGIGAIGILLIGASGALNALADSLFPSDTLIGGVEAELASTAPFLLRLRVFHPVIAVAVALGILCLVMRLSEGAGDRTKRIGLILAVTVGLQMFVGIANVVLLTPLETQVLHLALADVLWITYVVFSAELLGEPVPAERTERSSV